MTPRLSRRRAATRRLTRSAGRTSTRVPGAHRLLRAMSIVLALCGTGLAGCSIHWERAFYEGWRNANQRGVPADGAPVADAPQRLPSYEQYERERQRARGATAPASGASAPTPPTAPPAASEPAPG